MGSEKWQQPAVVVVAAACGVVVGVARTAVAVVAAADTEAAAVVVAAAVGPSLFLPQFQKLKTQSYDLSLRPRPSSLFSLYSSPLLCIGTTEFSVVVSFQHNHTLSVDI